MAVTVQQMVNARPGEYRQVAADLTTAAQTLRRAVGEFQAGLNTASSGWEGQTKGYAADAGERLSAGFSRASTTIEACARVCDDAAATLTALCTTLRVEVTAAKDLQFDVDMTTGIVRPSQRQLQACEDLGPGAPAALAVLMAAVVAANVAVQTAKAAVEVDDFRIAAELIPLRIALDSVIPFQRSLTYVPDFGYPSADGTGTLVDNNAQGAIGRDLSAAYTTLNHGTVLDSEVPVTYGVPMRSDLLVTAGADGRLRLVEVKSNLGGLTENQQVVLPRLLFGQASMETGAVPGYGGAGAIVPRGAVDVVTERWNTSALPDSLVTQLKTMKVQNIVNGDAGPALQGEMRAFLNNPANRVTEIL